MRGLEIGEEGLFPAEEVLKWVEHFLQYMGYELLPSSDVGSIPPDFRAIRQAETTGCEVAGIVCQNLRETPDGLAKLKMIKETLGDQVDYVLALPAVSEYFMIEFMTGEQGKWYYDIKEQEFMVWLCNPERETTTCLIGYPRDKLFDQYFLSTGTTMSFDALIGMRLSQMLMAEEAEEIRKSFGK